MKDDPDHTKIAPTRPFRPAGISVQDRTIGDQHSGHSGEVLKASLATPSGLLPPDPEKKAPTASLAQRFNDKLAKGR